MDRDGAGPDRGCNVGAACSSRANGVGGFTTLYGVWRRRKQEVYLTPKTTETEGKLSLVCTTATSETLTLPFFVVAS